MTRPRNPPIIFVMLLVAIAACEDEADKLSRLRHQQMMACLLAQARQGEADAALQERATRPIDYASEESQRIRRLSLRADSAQIACDLANRDLNRFMGGGS